MPISRDLGENRRAVQTLLGNAADVWYREFVTRFGSARALLVFSETLTDKTCVLESVLKPLMLPCGPNARAPRGPILAAIRDSVIPSLRVEEYRGLLQGIAERINEGHAVLFLEGNATALVLATREIKERSIEEPVSEIAVRSPREGFTETLRTNVGLVRKRIRDPGLRVDEITLGARTRTGVDVLYIEGLANDSLVDEVKNRLARIEIDGVLESGYIGELIEDDPYLVFPTVFNTERPDRAAAALLEGRVAILTDGSPFALVVPCGLADFLSTNEDYYNRYFLAALLRPIRYGAFLVSIFLPAFYVAATTFHQEMIPTRLFMSVARAREGVPFPAVVEALLMEATFEVMREAGIRLPRAFGQTISIVGAIVLGEAAVRAGIVSAPMVIVISLTAIAAFAVPSYALGIAARWLRLVMVLVAGGFGLFGVMLAALLVLTRLAAARSFGYPYLAPFAPLSADVVRDSILRAPHWARASRPRLIGVRDRRRAAPRMKPGPPGSTDDRPGGQEGPETWT